MTASENDRILTLELNFANFMKNVTDKFDAIMCKLDRLPETYATKEELRALWNKIKSDSSNKLWSKKINYNLIGTIVAAIAWIIWPIVVVLIVK